MTIRTFVGIQLVATPVDVVVLPVPELRFEVPQNLMKDYKRSRRSKQPLASVVGALGEWYRHCEAILYEQNGLAHPHDTPAPTVNVVLT